MLIFKVISLLKTLLSVSRIELSKKCGYVTITIIIRKKIVRVEIYIYYV